MTQIYDFLSLLHYPIGWTLQALAGFFTGIPVLDSIGAFGLAIIVTTLIIRALLFPLFGWQLRTQRRIQQEQRIIAPQLQELRKRYRKDPQKLSEEMKKLYAEHNMSPFSSLSGCLPTLVQLPVLFGLYRGILFAVQNSKTSHAHFLWIHNVADSVHDAVGGVWSNVITNCLRLRPPTCSRG
jgi:YidC/Oxa1 family membrane protein insertase